MDGAASGTKVGLNLGLGIIKSLPTPALNTYAFAIFLPLDF
jgi:hypothetical protein